MKKVLSVLVACSALVLAACGGESDSSSEANSSGYIGNMTLPTGNRYTCSSEPAYKLCKDDKTCAANCKLIATDALPVNPINPSVTTTCKKEGVNIYGTKGKSCIIPINTFNNSDGKRLNLDCSASGGASIEPNIKAGGSINLNGYKFSCR